MEQAKPAPGTTRARFLEGQARRAEDLRAALVALEASPDSPPFRDELKRELQGLLASARLFEQSWLVDTVQRSLVHLAERQDQALEPSDLHALQALVALLSNDAIGLSAHSGVHRVPDALASDGAPSAIAESDTPVQLTQTLTGLSIATLPARLLLVCSRPHAVRFRELLDDRAIEIVHAAEAEEATRLLHTSAPVCALLSAEYANLPDIDLVRRLQTDPLGQLGGVYVILPEGATYDAEFLRQTGADGVLIEPLTKETLSELVERNKRDRQSGLRALRGAAAGTVDEIASYVAEEIRSGIADSLRAGAHERIELGDTRELMAAAWSAIGRVRSHLAEQSRGRVRFRDDAVRELPSFLMQEPPAPEPEALEMLSGKRVLVADDDPAVLWFFAGLLRESGAHVLQANNGRDALSIARRKQPHLILSDILMPKVDGFALCREIKRDALLAHVPVILLSWKDDFLERMRELDAGANGYLRKEAGASEVLRVVCDALRPRQQLSAALRNETEVVGRIEGIGVIPLLERVAAERPDARVVVHDAWNLFEIEIRRGERVALTRTAADGTFARGERALLQLVGVNSGRFAVTTGSAGLKNAIGAPLGKALAYAGNSLAAMLDAVSDRRLVHVALLAFEEEVLAFLLNCTPTRLHEVAARFRSGGVSARELLFDGTFTPAELESDLRELARRGALTGVWDAEGEDLVAAARRQREEQPGELLHSSHPQTNQTSWYSSLRPAAANGGKAKSASAPAPEPASSEAKSDPVAAIAPSAESSSVESSPVIDRPLMAADDSLPPLAADDWVEPLMTEEELPLMAAKSPALHDAVEGVRLLVTLAALVAVGYFGWQRLEPKTRLTPSAAIDVVTTTAPKSAAPPPPPFVPPAPPIPTETAVQSGTDPSASLGTILPYIDQSQHVAVGPEQGLLVIRYVATAPPPLVRIDDREIGRPPRAIALDAGRHELMVHKKSDSSFRYLLVRAGETRVITLPF